MAKVRSLPSINFTLLFWLPKSELPLTETASSGKLQNQSCKQCCAFWRADIYPIITKTPRKSSVPVMQPQRTYPTRDGTHHGTNWLLALNPSVPSRQHNPPAFHKDKTFVGHARDDESIEFDYKINIEECAH